MSDVWIVDDDTHILSKLENILTRYNYSIRTFQNPEEIISELKSHQPAVIIADIFFSNSPLSGEDIIGEIKEKYPLIQSVIMSGESDIKKTLRCLTLGALDFLEKPVSLARLLTSIKNAETIYNSRLSIEKQYSILGNSPIIQNTINKIRKLALLNESVLIFGESGTGKELAARNLHLYSNRYSKPLSIVNCTALNSSLIESELFGHKKGSFTGADKDKKGYFEIADKSSLFIDEIGDFPLVLQAKLLRVLQEQKINPVGSNNEIEIDARLIFATHQNLDKLIEEKKFREDFFFRISTFTVTMPPLRDHLEDINIIATSFLDKFLSENNLTITTELTNPLTRDIEDLIKQGYHFRVAFYCSVIIDNRKVHKTTIEKELYYDGSWILDGALISEEIIQKAFGNLEVSFSDVVIKEGDEVLFFVKANILDDDIFKLSTGLNTEILWENYIPRIKKSFIYAHGQFFEQ